MLTTLVLLSALALMIDTTQALECGILLNDTSRNLSQIVSTCLIPTIVVATESIENVTLLHNTTNDDDPEEPPAYGPRRGLRIRRNDQNTTEPPLSTPLEPGSDITPKGNAGENPNDSTRCVVQCIMTAYNMIGSNGFPDLSKVASSLLKTVANREMRDVVQDSVDECFQQITESIDLDTCTYAARLGTCLADKARFNCSEWPVGELPFPHQF